MVADDFGALLSMSKETEQKTKDTDRGTKREYLRVYETLPPQMLNAYGPAKYAKMSDEAVWTNMSEPLKSGALYMTELCSKSAERRGTGQNRGIHALMLYCEYQNDPKVKQANEKVMKQEMYEELYKEIEQVLPSLKFCLAPKKYAEKKGASSLRSSGVSTDTTPSMGERKSETDLKKHSKIVYDFLDTGRVSRIRMLLNWQSAAGMAYVASVHHRALQCFRYCGNMKHSDSMKQVTLEDFQEGIISRHKLGTSGIDEAVPENAVNDFGQIVS